MKKRTTGLSMLFILLQLLCACATTSFSKSPGVDLSKIKTVYVIKLAADGRGINKIIANELNLLGYQAATGLETEIPEGVDATLTYQDRWMWDITMYMIRLNIQVRESKNGALLAEGESYRLSLQRKSPDEMAKEVLYSIFK